VRNLIRVDRPAREHRRDGQAVKLIKTLKGDFASTGGIGGMMVVKAPSEAVAQHAVCREDKAHERIGPRSGVPGLDGRET
jgi:hypothetical protein